MQNTQSLFTNQVVILNDFFVCLGGRLQPQIFCKQVFLMHLQCNSAFMKSFKNICDLIRIVIMWYSTLECAC